MASSSEIRVRYGPQKGLYMRTPLSNIEEVTEQFDVDMWYSIMAIISLYFKDPDGVREAEPQLVRYYEIRKVQQRGKVYEAHVYGITNVSSDDYENLKEEFEKLEGVYRVHNKEYKFDSVKTITFDSTKCPIHYKGTRVYKGAIVLTMQRYEWEEEYEDAMIEIQKEKRQQKLLEEQKREEEEKLKNVLKLEEEPVVPIFSSTRSGLKYNKPSTASKRLSYPKPARHNNHKKHYGSNKYMNRIGIDNSYGIKKKDKPIHNTKSKRVVDDRSIFRKAMDLILFV